jgi:hypothetical protein
MIAQNFVVDYALAKAQGVSQSEALKLALVASPFRPVFGMILAFALAREEAPQPVPVASTGYPGYGNKRFRGLFRQRRLAAPAAAAPAAPPAVQTISPGLQQLQQALATAGLPSLRGADKTQVEAWAQVFDLKPVYENGVTTGTVEWQEPGPNHHPAPGTTLKVRMK